MTAIVFDDLGQMWTSANMAFEEAYSVPRSQADLTKYAVKPLGFVALNMFGPSIQMQCALPVVAEPALTAAFTWLRARNFQRIAIDTYDGQWNMAVARSSEAAVTLLTDLLAQSPRCPQPPRILKRLPPSAMDQVPAFAKLHAEWLAGRAGLIPIEAANLAQRHLGSRYVVFEQGSDRQWYFKNVGPGYTHFGADWAKSCIGKPMIAALPDAVYANWVAEQYTEAVATNAARLDDLDVFACNTQGKRVRFRLKRIILPVIRDGKPAQLIGGTVRDDAMDLRQDALTALLSGRQSAAGRTPPAAPAAPHPPTDLTAEIDGAVA